MALEEQQTIRESGVEVRDAGKLHLVSLPSPTTKFQTTQRLRGLTIAIVGENSSLTLGCSTIIPEQARIRKQVEEKNTIPMSFLYW